MVLHCCFHSCSSTSLWCQCKHMLITVFRKSRQHVCFVRRRIQMSDVGFVKIISIWCLSVQFGRRSMKSIRENCYHWDVSVPSQESGTPNVLEHLWYTESKSSSLCWAYVKPWLCYENAGNSPLHVAMLVEAWKVLTNLQPWDTVKPPL